MNEVEVLKHQDNSIAYATNSTIEERLQAVINSKMRKTTRSLNYSNVLSSELAVAEQSRNRGRLLEIAYQYLLSGTPTLVEAIRP